MKTHKTNSLWTSSVRIQWRHRRGLHVGGCRSSCLPLSSRGPPVLPGPGTGRSVPLRWIVMTVPPICTRPSLQSTGCPGWTRLSYQTTLCFSQRNKYQDDIRRYTKDSSKYSWSATTALYRFMNYHSSITGSWTVIAALNSGSWTDTAQLHWFMNCHSKRYTGSWTDTAALHWFINCHSSITLVHEPSQQHYTGS